MKRHLRNMLKVSTTGFISISLLIMWLSSGMLSLSGCKKDRLFTHVDSIAPIPSQFHFFNGFSYDKSLELTVDGLPRETVAMYGFSQYYPSSSAFSLNSEQPNSKLINVNDPTVNTLYANLPTNNTFQFQPNTSYVVYPTYGAYDTLSMPLQNTVPTLNYYPEDIYHPFDGTTGVRLFNCISDNYGPPSINLTMTPNEGAGTTANLQPVPTYQQPKTAADSYMTTQAGSKTFSLVINSSLVVKLNFLPIQLDNGKNYSLFAVGDIKNFLSGAQPRPSLYIVQDGVPSSLKQLTFSSITYPGNISTLAEVTVINNAYNVPGLLSFGPSDNPTQYIGLDVHFNQTTVNVLRWPINPESGGEDIGDVYSLLHGSGPLNIIQSRVRANNYLTPGATQVNVSPGSGAFSPNYDLFDYNFQQGISYTVVLMPNNTTSQKCSQFIVENDPLPNAALFKLRVINLMSGTTQVDIHSGSPSGPVIFSGVSFGQANDYVSFTPNLTSQNLYVTAAGSTTPLFQTGANNTPLSLQFTAGNSGTIYLMGLLPGTPYAGDGGYFGPYVIYNSDAYVNPNTVLPTSQLFY